MKKISLLMLPVMALSLASCEKNNGELSGDDVIEFKDPNFLKALLVVQEGYIYDAATDDNIPYLMNVDANKDGAITVNEARNVKGLFLNNVRTYESFKISEMPEIKYFTSLTHLDCNNNDLTSLDVSHNTALRTLYCGDNQLTSLDVSHNTALQSLLCTVNQLTSLDVSNNPYLTYLYCRNNQLTSLYVGSCPDLVELNCNDNQLTSLDVHYNRELKYLSCSNNPLEKLIIYADNEISGMDDIESEYGDIIEYEY